MKAKKVRVAAMTLKYRYIDRIIRDNKDKIIELHPHYLGTLSE